MRTRKEYEELAIEASDKFYDSQPHLQSAMLALIHVVLLDIRDIAEGIDRRLGAKAITKKVVKKVKKQK